MTCKYCVHYKKCKNLCGRRIKPFDEDLLEERD